MMDGHWIFGTGPVPLPSPEWHMSIGKQFDLELGTNGYLSPWGFVVEFKEPRLLPQSLEWEEHRELLSECGLVPFLGLWCLTFKITRIIPSLGAVKGWSELMQVWCPVPCWHSQTSSCYQFRDVLVWMGNVPHIFSFECFFLDGDAVWGWLELRRQSPLERVSY